MKSKCQLLIFAECLFGCSNKLTKRKPGMVVTCCKPGSRVGVVWVKRSQVLVGVIPDHKMVTGPSWSGLRMIVPSSHYIRAPRKLEKSKPRRVACQKVERKVAGLILEGAITISISNHVALKLNFHVHVPILA